MKRAATLVVGVLLCAVAPAAAHDIPTDVRVQLFLRPQGHVLRLVARMPVAAMNDVDWPIDGVVLNLARTRPHLLKEPLA